MRIAGSKERFAAMMNERAAEIGMEDSHFVTPSGLDDPEHYSSAYDMALLAREALENPLFAEICAKPSAKLFWQSSKTKSARSLPVWCSVSSRAWCVSS